jgi:hypothetical protein
MGGRSLGTAQAGMPAEMTSDNMREGCHCIHCGSFKWFSAQLQQQVLQATKTAGCTQGWPCVMHTILCCIILKLVYYPLLPAWAGRGPQTQKGAGYTVYIQLHVYTTCTSTHESVRKSFSTD